MNIFSFVGSFFRHIRYGERIDPMRDWLILVSISVIVLAGVLVWTVWAFDTVVNGGTIGSAATSTTTSFDRTTLNEIKRIFADRSAEEAKYETGVYRFADPSQ